MNPVGRPYPKPATVLAWLPRLTSIGRILPLMAVNNEKRTAAAAPAAAPPLDSRSGPGEGDEPVTGFQPKDRTAPAPKSLPSAAAAFTGAVEVAQGSEAEVDPLAALTDKEREERRDALADIARAQHIAENLVGASHRR
jgi:hypothetical protein